MQQIINDVKCWRGFLNASIQTSECSASHCSHSFRNDWILIATTGSERDLKLILSDQKVKELCENCVLGTACQSCGEPGFVVAISRIEGSSGSIYTSPPSRSHNCDTRRKLNITSHFGPLCRANKMKMRFGCPTRWQRNVVHFQECWWVNHLFMKSWSGRLELWILDFCKGGKVERQRKSDMK